MDDQYNLYRIRCIYPDTSESESSFIRARHEEEAVRTYFIINDRDCLGTCELVVYLFATHEDANPA